MNPIDWFIIFYVLKALDIFNAPFFVYCLLAVWAFLHLADMVMVAWVKAEASYLTGLGFLKARKMKKDSDVLEANPENIDELIKKSSGSGSGDSDGDPHRDIDDKVDP